MTTEEKTGSSPGTRAAGGPTSGKAPAGNGRKGPRAAARATLRAFRQALPVILGVIAAVSLVLATIPRGAPARLFRGGAMDPVLGAAAGSIAAGNPITSYILGGEFLKHGVSMAAVTAFLVAWVTVGLVQLPAEGKMLGRRFAIVRNATAFVLAILTGILTVVTLNWMS